MLEMTGLVPLPPYIHRKSEPNDAERYQTIYAVHEGSVAAPTAGLHFTDKVLSGLESRGVGTGRLTLHVGVGTFRPVTAERLSGHAMHHERMIVPKQTIRMLADNPDRVVVAVGTTSARTLESLYWAGARLVKYGFGTHPGVLQWDPYGDDGLGEISTGTAFETLLQYLDRNGLDEYSGETRLMIVPGYRYRVLSALITNFHMPQSTLLLLVAALAGDDWKKAYDFAIAGRFRFLSYGDACLFFSPDNNPI
jgi:S-adenosylmethionine:tRNA ribosyltransferase-isomerase